MQANKYLLSLMMVCITVPGSAIAANEISVPAEAAAHELALNNGCFTCHALDKKVIGPAWKDVAAKYRSDAGAENRLVKKVSKGGKGVWGNENAMPPFAPHMKEADIRTLVKYVLSLK